MPAKAANTRYLVLRALNFDERLSKKQEESLGTDPFACLMYARMVLKGRLPDYLHNRMILGTWYDGEDQKSVKEYLEFTGNS